MRRIKVLLAVVAAVATMMVLAAPAMADSSFSTGSGGNSFDIRGDGGGDLRGVSLDGGSDGGFSVGNLGGGRIDIEFEGDGSVSFG